MAGRSRDARAAGDGGLGACSPRRGGGGGGGGAGGGWAAWAREYGGQGVRGYEGQGVMGTVVNEWGEGESESGGGDCRGGGDGGGRRGGGIGRGRRRGEEGGGRRRGNGRGRCCASSFAGWDSGRGLGYFQTGDDFVSALGGL